MCRSSGSRQKLQPVSCTRTPPVRSEHAAPRHAPSTATGSLPGLSRLIGLGELLLWGLFWLAVGIGVLVPDLTQWLARLLGVGRGADAVFYLSLVGLSYAFFRTYLRICHLEHQITLLIRKLALKEAPTPNDR